MEKRTIIISFIKKSMKEQKMKQKDLANIVGVTEATLWRIFNEKTDMPLCTYLKITTALNIKHILMPNEKKDLEV